MKRAEQFMNGSGSMMSELSADRTKYVITIDMEKVMMELERDQKIAGERVLNVPEAQLIDGLKFVANFVRKEKL